ncbi:B-cell receptor CD22 isoform X2 [Lates calcarifer]|uniref:B-cell receptor CD22 isoform X2 n=1 Tax=Lates calcarifer TaxID=8187 RepID=A0AAJ8DP76_LATCA|nr:B-cell receptor CD22 isoform X2 [Lates calcarifer]
MKGCLPFNPKNTAGLETKTAMLLAEAVCLFLAFILHISGVHGRSNRICALKGSSVDLPCSAEGPVSSMKWYTLHWNDSYILSNFSGDGSRYNISEGSDFNLIIKDLRESDKNIYCCSHITDSPGHCWFYRTELHVTDLQVKVIPTTGEQTVSLMCSTSCPLTENPAAYIWYKNREFLYQDWSPWYQQLVSSEEAVTYSCAIKGYEHLRAPEVSVDSVTSTCFTVTYADGTMCSKNQKSVDEPCSITYPTELYVERTPVDKEYVRLTCAPSCPLTDPKTAYRWYWNESPYKYSESQNFTVPREYRFNSYSCAIKGHEDLHTAQVCSSKDDSCFSVNYVRRRICALQGSSVTIISEYSYPDSPPSLAKFWYKIKRSGGEAAEKVTSDSGWVEYCDNLKNRYTLTINGLQKDDTAEYIFRLMLPREEFDFPGVTLVVSDLKVRMSPSAEVTEGQRVTLTCSTSCPLTDDKNYIWFLNSRPLTLPENQNKHLVLDPVSSQHAGNYSCAVKIQRDIRSPEEILTVQVFGKSIAAINAVRLAVVLLIPVPLLLFHLWLRWTHSIRTSHSAAQREPEEQQKDSM